MRARVAVLLLIGTASGAGAAPIDMNKFLQLDEQLLQCFDTQAQRLDDGRSDARSVATGVYAACGREKMAALAGAGMTGDLAAKTLQATREQDVDRATISVLKLRASKR